MIGSFAVFTQNLLWDNWFPYGWVKIQRGRRFLGVACSFDQELMLSSDISFSQAKEKLFMSRCLEKQRLYFLLFWYGSSLDLFPVSRSLPCIRPAKQINACGSLFAVFVMLIYLSGMIWDQDNLLITEEKLVGKNNVSWSAYMWTEWLTFGLIWTLSLQTQALSLKLSVREQISEISVYL